ncbi:MAG: plasmid pRiA4b ORF-3 family protein [Thermoplasmataceae archaeon]
MNPKSLESNFSGAEAPRKDSKTGSKKTGKKGHSNILQIKVAIKGIRPSIWRKLLVNSDATLHELHLMIQAAFGWENYHLYEFYIGRNNYTTLVDLEENDKDAIDSSGVTLEDLHLQEGNKFTYVYDFGDNWEHLVSVDKILPPDPSVLLPSCIGGKRKCPPEDCGGVYGYYDILKEAKDPQDPEHEASARWLGEYDPEEFDMESADFDVLGYKGMEDLSDTT